MKIRLVRINRQDMDHHQGMIVEGCEPLFFWYEELSGRIEVWPRDTAHKYELTITIQEK